MFALKEFNGWWIIIILAAYSACYGFLSVVPQYIPGITGLKDPWPLIVSVLSLGFIFWIVYLICNRLEMRLRGRKDLSPLAEFLLKLLTPLTSVSLGIFLPLVSVLLVALGIIMVAELWRLVEHRFGVTSAVVAELSMAWFFGLTLEKYYLHLNRLRINRNVGDVSQSREDEEFGRDRGGLRYIEHNLSEPIETSQESNELLVENNKIRRREKIGLIVAPLAGLVIQLGLLFWNAFSFQGIDSATIGIGFIVMWTLVLSLAFISKMSLVAGFTPFRQLRLVAGAAFSLLLFVVLGILAIPIMLSGRKLTDTAYGMAKFINKLLRSWRILWALYFLLSPSMIVALIGYDMKINNLSLLVNVIFSYGGYLLVHKLYYRVFVYKIFKSENSLIYLRVFGDPGRSQFLFDRIIPLWRLGGVVCIGAPDVSVHKLDLGEIVYSLIGQLFYQSSVDPFFVTNVFLDLKPGEVQEIHCFGDTWKKTLTELFRRNSVVLVDLRGFTVANRGCEYELQYLLSHNGVEDIVILIDSSTDDQYLKQSLKKAWQIGGLTSSMRVHVKQGDKLMIARLDSTGKSAAETLIRMLCNAAAARDRLIVDFSRKMLQDVVTDIRFLAASYDKQLRQEGSKNEVLKHLFEHNYYFDPDLDIPDLVAASVITDDQAVQLNRLWEALHMFREQGKQKIEVLNSNNLWNRLREEAVRSLLLLGEKPN